jgi:hypothetical protein
MFNKNFSPNKMALLLKKPTLVLPNVVWVLDFLNDPQIQFFEIPDLFLTFFREWWLYVRPNPLIFQDQWL